MLIISWIGLWEGYYGCSALSYRKDGVFLAMSITIIHGSVPLANLAKLSFAYMEGGDLLSGDIILFHAFRQLKMLFEE